MSAENAPDNPLEGDHAARSAWLRAASDFVLEHLAGLEHAPATGIVGAEGNRRAAALSRPIGEAPLPGGMDGALEILREAVELSLNAAGPGYLAYIPGGGLPLAGVAELIAGSCNRFTGMSAAAPGFCRLEADVLAWLAEAFGYGARARGIFTSGGSTANLTAIVCARLHVLGDDGDFSRAVAYTSSQSHHSVQKALRIAGVPARNLRDVDVDDDLELRPDALEAAIAADRAAGLRPFLVIAAAGTTNTGAVDPMGPIAEITGRHGLWFHVDGAYGGAFVLSPRGRPRLRGIERADSITFDPHKGLFLPYGTGCLLVADGARLARAHHGDGEYLQDFEAPGRDGEPPSPCDYGPELSRSFRGLRLWLPLMVHGAGAFRRALDEKLELAEAVERALRGRIDAGVPLEIAAPTRLSAVAFRLRRRPGEALESQNRRNAALLRAINDRQGVHLSSTLLPGPLGMTHTLRICVLSFRTHRDRIDRCLADVDAALADLDESAHGPVAS
ncbi:MAG: aminotransferase class V-fold PLP-dependent enzyme [Nannocystaceae bacterium]